VKFREPQRTFSKKNVMQIQRGLDRVRKKQLKGEGFGVPGGIISLEKLPGMAG